MAEDVDLPVSGETVAVDPYDIDDPEDMNSLVDLFAVAVAERVDADGMTTADVERMPMMDVLALAEAIFPTGADADD